MLKPPDKIADDLGIFIDDLAINHDMLMLVIQNSLVFTASLRKLFRNKDSRRNMKRDSNFRVPVTNLGRLGIRQRSILHTLIDIDPPLHQPANIGNHIIPIRIDGIYREMIEILFRFREIILDIIRIRFDTNLGRLDGGTPSGSESMCRRNEKNKRREKKNP